MKHFRDFNEDAGELFQVYFTEPKIIDEHYKHETEDEYDVWYFIIESKGALFLLSIANPDGGENGIQQFDVRHLLSFDQSDFHRRPDFYFVECDHSCYFSIANTVDINAYK